MNTIVKLALGLCALGSAAVAVAPSASAQTWGSAVGPNGYTQWNNGWVTGKISTTNLDAWYGTVASASNKHVGGYAIQCTNRPLDGWPVGPRIDFYGSAWRNDYQCYSGVQSSYGWVQDN